MLWYAAYGSNLDRTRFLHYLLGGAAPGAQRVLAGARDPSPPRDERPFTFAGTMFFGWESPTWGGGISFVEVDGLEARSVRTATDDVVLARAYLLTEEQFSDVGIQEMHRDLATAAPVDLAPVLANLAEDRQLACLVRADVFGEHVEGHDPSIWVVLARREADLAALPRQQAGVSPGQTWSPVTPAAGPVWTDERANLFSAWNWKAAAP